MKCAVALSGFLLVMSADAIAFDITGCQQRVPPRTAAVLQTDLTCLDAEFAVLLGNGARLNLNGHVLTGPFSATPSGDRGPGVLCPDGGCAVQGPGEINSFSFGINMARISEQHRCKERAHHAAQPRGGRIVSGGKPWCRSFRSLPDGRDALAPPTPNHRVA